MNMSPTVFRWMLVASFVFAIVGEGIDLMIPSLVPEALSSAEDAIDEAMPFWRMLFVLAVGLVGMVATCVAYFCLYFFKPWASYLAIFGTVFSLLFYPLIGIMVSSGWSLAFSYASTLLLGAAIAMAHFSPLKEKFLVPTVSPH